MAFRILTYCKFCERYFKIKRINLFKELKEIKCPNPCCMKVLDKKMQNKSKMLEKI